LGVRRVGPEVGQQSRAPSLRCSRVRLNSSRLCSAVIAVWTAPARLRLTRSSNPSYGIALPPCSQAALPAACAPEGKAAARSLQNVP
jgi:hypothetical protein